MATYSLSMIYTGYKQVGTWWNYKNVISPFYRLYYIESGKGRVYIGTTAYDLTPGTLFLIPKFALHSYECEKSMNHYYICFFDDLPDGRGVPHPSALQVKTAAQETDAALIRRYLELNPMKQLAVSDPQHYDNNRTLYPTHDDTPVLSRFSQQMESEGILLQLFSRFITDESIKGDKSARGLPLDTVIRYINQHLDQHISVQELADLAYWSPDHFTKVFKKVMGLPPCSYIQLKRIERAQSLLLTSDLSIMQIAEKVGIYSPAQFTRLFTKIAQCSPKEYRNKQLSI